MLGRHKVRQRFAQLSRPHMRHCACLCHCAPTRTALPIPCLQPAPYAPQRVGMDGGGAQGRRAAMQEHAELA